MTLRDSYMVKDVNIKIADRWKLFDFYRKNVPAGAEVFGTIKMRNMRILYILKCEVVGGDT